MVEIGKAVKKRKDIRDYFGKIKIVLIILSILASIKMLFFAFGLDEEYQLVMSYRNLRGDELFHTMWEPHQSSAFLCTLLMRPYLALFGKTGVVIWLRFCGTLIHMGVSFYLYRVLCRMIRKDSAFLIGLTYYNIIPKQIMMPEFGIMQVWFLTLLSLFLIQYYDSDVREKKYLILAALSLVLTILSYPSCLILYFPAVWIIWRRSGKKRLADLGIFTGVCALCGVLYLGMLLRNNTVEGLLHVVSYIVDGDITHSLTLMDKVRAYGKGVLAQVVLCLAIFGLARIGAALTLRGKRKRGVAVAGEEEIARERLLWTVALTCLLQLYGWTIGNIGYEEMQIYVTVFALLGLSCYHKTAGEKRQEGLLADCIVLAVFALLAVLYLTDRRLMESLPHGMPAALFGMVLVVMYWEKAAADKTAEAETGRVIEVKAGTDKAIEMEACRTQEAMTSGDGAEKSGIGAVNARAASFGAGRPAACIYAILLLWALTMTFGKGYNVRGGTNYQNVLQSRGILKYGPAAGTIADYMRAYIYNCDYEDLREMVQDGDRVLVMVDQVMNLGTIRYLFRDVEVCHYSIVNPTPYDERLLAYWEMFPEKEPNVIIVDAWYGQLMTDPEGWLMRYVEEEFGYTSMQEGRYVRVYRKE